MKMRPVKIFHEAPLCLFDQVQEMTDGDYALVHLLESNPGYAARFRSARRDREVILDNSAYELGQAFNPRDFANWVDLIRPTTYVVPDVMGSSAESIEAFADWTRTNGRLPGRKMGVIQGDTAPEAIKCFKSLVGLGADIIGVPFLIGRNWFKAIKEIPTSEQLMQRRVALIDQIWDHCDPHPIHLLGVALPQEGTYYREMSWIESVDTSNPIIHGMFGERYGPKGVSSKRPELLADNINEEMTPQQEEDIMYNIVQFRKLWERI